MIIALRIFFFAVLVSMLGITSWASFQCALWETPRAVATHPWFLATLLDTYWGFLTFYLWIYYKETGWVSRLGWLVGVLLLGNIAMAIYALIQLFRVPADSPIEKVLLRRERAV